VSNSEGRQFHDVPTPGSRSAVDQGIFQVDLLETAAQRDEDGVDCRKGRIKRLGIADISCRDFNVAPHETPFGLGPVTNQQAYRKTCVYESVYGACGNIPCRSSDKDCQLISLAFNEALDVSRRENRPTAAGRYWVLSLRSAR